MTYPDVTAIGLQVDAQLGPLVLIRDGELDEPIDLAADPQTAWLPPSIRTALLRWATALPDTDDDITKRQQWDSRGRTLAHILRDLLPTTIGVRYSGDLGEWEEIPTDPR
ncbi:hypothetical protein [Actinokineospora pegani]|uniref:hypothetical protein n=1 Tax=Actinokineospora pegani TaxID=2654637 RepID=UPI0012EA0946|nr:hypothetical protein [Actinokineospora pegani]